MTESDSVEGDEESDAESSEYLRRRRLLELDGVFRLLLRLPEPIAAAVVVV